MLHTSAIGIAVPQQLWAVMGSAPASCSALLTMVDGQHTKAQQLHSSEALHASLQGSHLARSPCPCLRPPPQPEAL